MFLSKYYRYIIYLIVFISLTALGFLSLQAGAEESPLEITVSDAIVLALENNSGFKVELLKPDISLSQEEQARAAFDPNVSSTLSASGSHSTSGTETKRNNLGLQISRKLFTGGNISLGLNIDDTGGGTGEDRYNANIGLSLTHPLFKGAGPGVNLAGVRKAELNTETSLYELQAYAESLVAQVEETYFNYALAQRRVKIYEDSLNLAEQQLNETQVLVDVGKIAEVELVATQAEVASRKEGLINARSDLSTLRLALLRLMNPPGMDLWTQGIVVKDEPTLPEFDNTDINPHFETALQKRPDLNQAKLLMERNELDIITTKNGLLPNLELFITLGTSGYAGSFGSLISDISPGNNDFKIGIDYTTIFGERDSRARYNQSLISKEQAQEALNNLTQLAVQDVGVAWIEINRADEQISATAASRVLQEEKLRAEKEKYRVGKSTSLLVAQAQRDLLSAQIAEIEAIANYRKALVELYKSEGILLDQHGISLFGEKVS